MTFTIEFIRLFSLGMVYASPLLLGLVFLIAIIGQIIGRREGWSRLDSLYYAFVTATTVGYGDITPGHSVSKFSSIAIALLGIMLTGLIVALGLHAATIAFTEVNAEAIDQLKAS